MTELEMNVGVIRRPRQPLSISRLGLRQPPGVLQHVAVLHADVGARRCQPNRVLVGRRPPGIVPRVPQAIPVTDKGFDRLWGRCLRRLRGPQRDELDSRGSAVRQQSLGVAKGCDRLLYATG